MPFDSSAGGAIAIDEAQETRGDTIFLWQLVTKQADPGKSHDVIQAVIAFAGRLVPNRHGDIDCLEHVQFFPHRVAIGNAWFALDPVAYGNNMIAAVLGIDIGAAVARRREACRKRWFARAP